MRTVSADQRQLIGAAILFLAGTLFAVYRWMTDGFAGIIFILLGLLTAAVGFAIWRGTNKQISDLCFISGVVALLIALVQVWIETQRIGPTIAVFVIAFVFLFEGYQFRQMT